MSYIIFDLEFNQDYGTAKEDKTEKALMYPFEIIQLGAVKLDEKLSVVCSLDRIIKPEIYPELHPYVKEMTGITQEQLDAGKTFRAVCGEFIELAKGGRSILCVWGMADIKELFRNMSYHGMNKDLLPKEYINLQAYASRYLKCPKGTNIGLRNAVELLNIGVKEQFHHALNDAYYTSEIFKKIYSKKMKIRVYSPENYRVPLREHKNKDIIDNKALISQFEKMFNREMTEEEKRIIKLAYIMGKTNQFSLDNTKK